MKPVTSILLLVVHRSDGFLLSMATIVANRIDVIKTIESHGV